MSGQTQSGVRRDERDAAAEENARVLELLKRQFRVKPAQKYLRPVPPRGEGNPRLLQLVRKRARAEDVAPPAGWCSRR